MEKNPHEFRVEVWGDFALFTRPETSAERYTYPVMTPSAARGILTAIYWHPGLDYKIDEIDVLNPIQYVRIMTNEISEKISAHSVVRKANRGEAIDAYTREMIQQRSNVMLKKVRYVIHAHIEMVKKMSAKDSLPKFFQIVTRRAKNGQCYYQPSFGCRECPVDFRLLDAEKSVKPIPDSKNFGWMLYGMNYHDDEVQRKLPTPRYFEAKMVNGVIDLRDCEVRG